MQYIGFAYQVLRFGFNAILDCLSWVNIETAWLPLAIVEQIFTRTIAYSTRQKL
jgi:alkylation response protein AidB-like acyl-CoA dehydrogenase